MLPTDATSDTHTLYISQFIPSTLRWPEVGNLLLTQETGLSTQTAEGGGAKAVLEVNLTLSELDAEAAATLDLKLRAPAWAAAGSLSVLRAGQTVGSTKTVSVGAASFLDVSAPGGGWQAGDVVAASFSMVPRLKPINDKRSAYKQVAAIMMGPYVMGEPATAR